MKVKVMLSIDKEVKERAMYIIQNVLHSTLSQEVEDYLQKITEGSKK